MKRSAILAPIVALAGLVLAFGTAQAVVINCPGDSIQAALDAGETDLEINGTCVENVTVRSDDVEMYGSGSISGALAVIGAQRFIIQQLTVADSAGVGIELVDGASARIFAVTVENNPYDSGIDVRKGSYAGITDSVIQGNRWGLTVGLGGVVDGWRNTIMNNEDEQVSAYQHGTYRANSETIDRGTGARTAVSLSRNSYVDFRRGTSVTGRSSVELQSHLWIREESTVTGRIVVALQSALDVAESSVVEGNVRARGLSIVRILDDATVTGTVNCFGISICLQ
jgi:cytoskeletal protein CcmA (bactofilin family)